MRRVNDYVTRFAYISGVKDEAGDGIDTWNPVGEQVGIFEFDPGGSDEPFIPGHDRVVTTPTMYLPFKCPLRQNDKVEVDGETFRVVGNPASWKHRRTGREVGDVVKLKRVTG